jgi:hypothetical protein
MTTPKEKAKELIEKYSNVEIQIGGQYDGYLSMQIHDAKQCALIAVDEIAKCTKYEKQKFDNDRFSEDYWQEVKTEIEKL